MLAARYCSTILTRNLTLSSRMAAQIKVGDKLPSVEVGRSNPGDKLNLAELYGTKKGLLVGIVGAFTSTCQNDHIPDYIKNRDALQSKGYEVVSVISVNDEFVMSAFGEKLGAGDKVHFLADSKSEFAKAAGLELPVAGILGTDRMKRFLAEVTDGKISRLEIEENPAVASCTVAATALKW